jgi:hypothetical protein
LDEVLGILRVSAELSGKQEGRPTDLPEGAFELSGGIGVLVRRVGRIVGDHHSPCTQ